ncbi:MAG: ABC transporter permease [Firmicutes bacterium]|nr:ABC transporter permease [Bacillota bacterium]
MNKAVNFFNSQFKKVKNFRITRKVFSYPYILFMLLFVVIPLVMILANAFMAGGSFTFQNFADFFSSPSGLLVLLESMLVGLFTVVICLAIGFPVAYFIAKYTKSGTLVLLFILPMWVNFLIRTLSTKALFDLMGIQLGLGTVIFGMVYNFLPFMILPIHTTLTNLDKHFAEAAGDLGASEMQVFLKVIVPLSLPGVVSGITMVFIPTISTFAISSLLSNGMVFLFGDSIYTKFNQGLYGVGSVMSLIMFAFVLVSNMFMNKFNKAQTAGRQLW